MSTRYVWGRYLPSTNPVLNETYRLTTNYELGYHESDFEFCTIQDEYTVNTNNSSVYYKNFGKKSLLSIYQQYSETSIDLQPLNVSGGQVSLADGDKFVFSTEQNATLTDDSYISECDASSGVEITFKKRSNGKVYYTVASNTSERDIRRIITKNTLTTETIAGTPDGTVSSSAASAHPSNGLSGSYWYEYQGQDTIDPTGVDYVSPAKSARISPYSVFATRSPTGRLLSISTKPHTPSNPSFRVLIASNASLTFAIKWL